MKIGYKKIIRSTNIDHSTLSKNIIEELDKGGYRITNQTQNFVEFKYNIWALGSRAKVFKTVDGGTFVIAPESKTIVFSFYLSPIFEILAICVAAFFGITQDYHFFFFIIFIVFMFVLRLISIKITANEMMSNIMGMGNG